LSYRDRSCLAAHTGHYARALEEGLTHQHLFVNIAHLDFECQTFTVAFCIDDRVASTDF